ncbi:MAG: hypothetical protein WCQ77_12360 [Planctomycetota bacterium]
MNCSHSPPGLSARTGHRPGDTLGNVNRPSASVRTTAGTAVAASPRAVSYQSSIRTIAAAAGPPSGFRTRPESCDASVSASGRMS